MRRRLPAEQSAELPARRHVHSPYLEQLDPDAGEHELEKGGDDHDVADGPDGHEDALDHMLGREGPGEGGGGLPALCFQPRANVTLAKIFQVHVHFYMIFQPWVLLHLFFRSVSVRSYP